jgi:crossover junction endodeoxyribonuclease RuvC
MFQMAGIGPMLGQANWFANTAPEKIPLAIKRYIDESARLAPRLIKQTVVGYGGAEKQQVQEMVKLLLKMTTVPTPHDAADALAIAICHFHHAGMQDRIEKSLKKSR